MEQKLLNDLVEIRRKIHAHPELGFREHKTADIVAEELNRIDIPFRRGIARTGIVAELEKGNGPCVLLRADMDALPIEEDTGLPFLSKNKGVMHACGHDLHTTILLGAAHILKASSFNGKIKMLFQPSEEGTYPGLFEDGSFKSGGQRVVEAGEMDEVHAALGLHVHPLLPTGKIAYTKGQALAAVGFFKILIKGKAGHAAFPEQTIDPILACSQIITNAQNIISRYTSPSQPKVISFTKIEGGVNENIIPGEVTMLGTVRALDADTYSQVVGHMKKVLTAVALMSGAEIDLTFSLDYPSLLNDQGLHEKLSGTVTEIFGRGNLIEMAPLMGGEDFAFYSRKKPSVFYFLGANDGVNSYFLHHPKVIFDEKCIGYGADFLAQAALQLLSSL